ncbi:hypothetical protein BELL_0598g00030 [Botrytis elliptica]|uniref:F-box domain-containing protein n=1 Tax=Botrytis elliptica TaxID=278938 RepID=A0A4Z1JDG0_9HELO|nr:hypothetical protein EAE99_010208 [Botrytis elliptica]TGO71274.1 hypothetical protein BELL_0598g00030 [Botrytis elliptica]
MTKKTIKKSILKKAAMRKALMRKTAMKKKTMKKMFTKKTAKENATIDNTIMAMNNMEIDTPTSSWLTASQTQAFKALERSTEDDSFFAFEFLPLEVQVMILKYALPQKCLIRMGFRTVFNNFNMILNFQMLPDMHLTPLLNTSWLFNNEVNKEFKKVELRKYSRGVKSKLYKALHDENYSPPDYFWDRCRRNIFHERGSGYRSLSHVYIRPETDTLIIDYRQLFILYFVGGSIDLSNVKHIALANVRPFQWDWPYHPLQEDDVDRLIHGLISVECPNLEKLTYIISNDDPMTEMHLDTEEVIFDVNDELYYQDFEFEDGTLHNERPHSLMQAKAEVDDCFQGFLRQLGSGFRLKDDVMNFWKVHVPGVGMIARFDADADWRLRKKRCPEPRYYFVGFDTYLPAHADGTILGPYKGLAQIFEGAPW